MEKMRRRRRGLGLDRYRLTRTNPLRLVLHRRSTRSLQNRQTSTQTMTRYSTTRLHQIPKSKAEKSCRLLFAVRNSRSPKACVDASRWL